MGRDLAIGIIGSVIGTVVFIFIQKIFYFFKNYHKSEYSGVWVDTIPKKEDGTPEKHDEFTIKHNKNTNELSGTIKRISPPEQSTRRWAMNGVINHGFFIAAFWREGPQKSNGCICAKLTNDYEYSGYYLEEHDGEIDKTPIILKKKNIENKR